MLSESEAGLNISSSLDRNDILRADAHLAIERSLRSPSDIEKRRFREYFVDCERAIESENEGLKITAVSPYFVTCQLPTNRVFVALFGRFSYPSTPPTATFQVNATRLFSSETDGGRMLPSSASPPSRSRPSCSPLASVLDQLNGGEPGDSMGLPCHSSSFFQPVVSEMESVCNGNGTCG